MTMRLLFAVAAGIVEQAKPLNLSAFLHYWFFRWGKERQAFHAVVLFFFPLTPLCFFPILGAAFPPSLWPWKECSIGVA